MKTLRNERGVALVLVLLLSVVALLTIAGLLYMLSRGGLVSGQQKRYTTAREAVRGGAEVTFQVIGDRGGTDNTLYTNFVTPGDLATKLANPTGAWGGLDSSSTIDPTNQSTYDLRFDLGPYRVYSKIVDTVAGNSGADMKLEKTQVVGSGSGEVTVMSIPYLYTVEELAQSTTNPSERAKMTILYQY